MGAGVACGRRRFAGRERAGWPRSRGGSRALAVRTSPDHCHGATGWLGATPRRLPCRDPGTAVTRDLLHHRHPMPSAATSCLGRPQSSISRPRGHSTRCRGTHGRPERRGARSAGRLGGDLVGTTVPNFVDAIPSRQTATCSGWPPSRHSVGAGPWSAARGRSSAFLHAARDIEAVSAAAIALACRRAAAERGNRQRLWASGCGSLTTNEVAFSGWERSSSHDRSGSRAGWAGPEPCCCSRHVVSTGDVAQTPAPPAGIAGLPARTCAPHVVLADDSLLGRATSPLGSMPRGVRGRGVPRAGRSPWWSRFVVHWPLVTTRMVASGPADAVPRLPAPTA